MRWIWGLWIELKNRYGKRCNVCFERRVGRSEVRCWSEAGCDGLREGGVGRRVCEGVSWEGGGIWLWCEWERGLKEGLWEN